MFFYTISYSLAFCLCLLLSLSLSISACYCCCSFCSAKLLLAPIKHKTLDFYYLRKPNHLSICTTTCCILFYELLLYFQIYGGGECVFVFVCDSEFCLNFIIFYFYLFYFLFLLFSWYISARDGSKGII